MATNNFTLRLTTIEKCFELIDALPTVEDKEAVVESLSSAFRTRPARAVQTNVARRKKKRASKVGRTPQPVDSTIPQVPTEKPVGGWGQVPIHLRTVDGRSKNDLVGLLNKVQRDYEKFYPSQKHPDRASSSNEQPPGSKEAYRDARMYIQDCLQFLKNGEYCSVRSGKVPTDQKPEPPDSFRDLFTKETSGNGGKEPEVPETVKTVL